jgi:hypothetical protein
MENMLHLHYKLTQKFVYAVDEKVCIYYQNSEKRLKSQYRPTVDL